MVNAGCVDHEPCVQPQAIFTEECLDGLGVMLHSSHGRAEQDIQKITDKYIGEVDKVSEEKQQEIMDF